MDTYYIIVVAVLFILAISDLVVGVANDAVNFLNAAIGAKVARGWVIMVIASLGVFIGATFSSGMMEVARKGIFNPEMYVFADIMVIFVAVMLADILLLDLFNSLGLPTSTTVSIVFELLGAAIVVALIVIWQNPETQSTLGDFINTNKALGIISGILISVVIAFSVGTIIMYISRLLFSFRYKKNLKYFGGIFGGLAITAITYFMLIKGIDGASFISSEQMDYIKNNSKTILLWSLLGWTILLQLLNFFFKIDSTKIIVLVGTFSLAMAFAGNDLVNFIGVPIAGLDAFVHFSQSGVADTDYTMEILHQAVKTPTWMLLIAGGIMVVTLWTSKKAKAVLATSVNLSRQDEGIERFSSTAFSRMLVRSTMNINSFFDKITPNFVAKWIESRFKPYVEEELDVPEGEKPAFDMIRAAVNLTVASTLIAMGTSLKLPLSTTYVTFMVAMGASLADRAWGRDSAVYRITGVFAVISGWFVTALAAFTMAFLIGGFVYLTKPYGLFIMLGLVAISVYKSFKRTKKNDDEQKIELAIEKQHHIGAIRHWVDNSNESVKSNLIQISKIYFVTINGLIEEDRKALKSITQDAYDFNEHSKKLKNDMFKVIRNLNKVSEESSQYYVQILDYMREAAHSIRSITEPILEHVNNNHKPIKEQQRLELIEISEKMSEFFNLALHLIVENNQFKTKEVTSIISEIIEQINKSRRAQIKRIKSGDVNTRNSILYLIILQESKSMILHLGNMLKSLRDFMTHAQK
ncbi:MAG: inorganic phosphate transporter [Salinivirgaceae bacterium]|nr:inorganic phosphate transporter [Salinivirgaceae bacterium]